MSSIGARPPSAPGIQSSPGAVGGDLRGLLTRASRRMIFTGTVAMFGPLLLAMTIALATAMLVEKLTFLRLPWGALVPGAIGAAAIGAFAWSLATLPRGAALADEVDRRAGLRETLSTAVLLERAGPGRGGVETDPAWRGAVIENARERARRVVLSDAMPIRVDERSMWWSGILAVALVIGAFVPGYDLTGVLSGRDEERRERDEAESAKAEITAKEKEIEEILARANVALPDDEADPADEPAEAGEPKRVEDIRREAIRKMTNLSDQLKELQQGPQAKQYEAMRQAMRQLKAPPPGPATEFQRQLARGNFSQAQAELQKLEEQLSSDKVPAEERKQAAAQLAALAEQLNELAEQKDSLENALKQAGLSAQQAQAAAKDPSELEKMLSQMPGIPAPTQQALRQMSQAQENASQAMQSMAQAAQGMCNACKNPGQGAGQQMSQAAGQMSSELSAAEMMASEQAAASQALAEAQGQLQKLGESLCEGGACNNPGNGQNPGSFGQTGQWKPGDGTNQGSGSGGPGRGNGAGPDALPEDYILKREKAKVQNQGGPIIGSTVVYGSQVRGESAAVFSTAAKAATSAASEAIETMQVPREYHDAVRAYFGSLEKAVKDKAVKDAPASPGDGQN